LDIDNILLVTDQDKIHALHSFKVPGGTLLRPTTKLMCLICSGSCATALLIDKQSLLNPCNLVTPTIDDLQECSNKDEVNTIYAPPDNRAVTNPGLASFFAAPWLVNMIMDAGTSKDSKLIPEVNAAAIKFGTKHKTTQNTQHQHPMS
jgi:hypothetical protein